MNQPDEPPERLGGDSPPPPSPPTLLGQLRPAVIGAILLTIATGCVFPLALLALGRVSFPRQASGSLVMEGASAIGSELIGQDFTKPEHFHPRPSAAGAGYDAGSSGTNLGPNNPKLKDGAVDGSFAGVGRLAGKSIAGRTDCPRTPPSRFDAVTRSGSGLDPHISPANAALQIPRIARARGVSEEDVRRLVTDYTQGPQLGFLGGARVSALALNLALDRAAARRSGSSLDRSLPCAGRNTPFFSLWWLDLPVQPVFFLPACSR